MDNQKMKWETVYRSETFEEANEKRNDLKKDGKPVKIHHQNQRFHVKVGTPAVNENVKEVEANKAK